MSNLENIPSHSESLPNVVDQVKGMIGEEKLEIFNNDAQQLAEMHTMPLTIKVGDVAPDFSLPNASGDIIKLANVLNQGAVVLTFYRGTWCPYCNLHLSLLQTILPEIIKLNANLVAISPMTPDNSKGMVDSNKLEFNVLSDVDNDVARQYTTVFKNSDTPIKAMADLGYDFFSFYDNPSAELPVAATFVISQKGVVVFAESEGGDYRKRTEPKAILAALKSISGE